MNTQNTDFSPAPADEMLNDIRYSKALQIAELMLSRGLLWGNCASHFYGLDRFSEDLDFSLATPDPAFELASYFPTLKKEVASYGLNTEISEKAKTKESAIKSAFLKDSAKEHMLLIWASDPAAAGIPGNEKIKIRIKADTNPPAGASFDHKYRLLPAPYDIALYDMPSLFAGKAHAVICRAWKNRVKGRDLYDLNLLRCYTLAVFYHGSVSKIFDNGVYVFKSHTSQIKDSFLQFGWQISTGIRSC